MFPLHVTWPSPVVAELVAAGLYVLLAAIVTIDILLKKSDVRSAMGWIATVWLAPIFGSLLYYLFGINRVTRRALRLRRGNEALTHLSGPAAPEASANIRPVVASQPEPSPNAP